MATKLKNKFLISFIALLCFGLYGCSEVQYIRIVFANGSVQDQLIVELDKDKITSAGINYDALSNEIKIDLNNIFISSVARFMQENNENEIVQNNIKKTVEVKPDSVVAIITYETREVFNLYAEWVKEQSAGSENDDDTNNNLEVSKEFFYITYTQSSASVFGNIYSGVALNIQTKYSSILNNNFTVANDMKFSQIYGSTNTSMKSNAHETETNLGVKLHYWEVDPLNMNQKIEFYTTVPNTANWYISAIIISLVVALAIVSYNMFFKNKKTQ